MKIGYRNLSGSTSTAYLDEEDYEPEEVAAGADKYTDEPVAVQWDGIGWVEVDGVLTRRVPPKEAA